MRKKEIVGICKGIADIGRKSKGPPAKSTGEGGGNETADGSVGVAEAGRRAKKSSKLMHHLDVSGGGMGVADGGN